METEGFDVELNSYVRSFGTEEADASMLQLPRYRYCDAADPRTIGTMAHLDRQLATGFPQAFSHVGLINAAVALARAQQNKQEDKP